MSATTEPVVETKVENLLDESAWTGKIFSDGWVDAPVQIETVEPATGEVLGTAGGGDAASIARAAKSAAAAQRDWAETPFADRVAVIKRAAEVMERHRDELIELARSASPAAIGGKADVEITRLDRPARHGRRADLAPTRHACSRRSRPAGRAWRAACRSASSA